ncbi:MAG: 3',5'-cyclic-nucleotide phosphodiesterase [Burkholderiales bacterium]|nr:3',5'-cyclic-nucleotide phosphodiesterase [Burkholderiales bacterium]
MIRLKVLGASGGIGGEARTTALQVDEDTLIDCGTGVGDSPLAALIVIDQVFLTHAHLDHIALLPMLADARVDRRDEPLVVHGLPETLQTLRECIFNNRVWPDYTSEALPYVRLQPVALGETVEIGGRRFQPLPVKHAIPACAWRIDSGAASLVFTGDTTYSETFFAELKHIANLRHLIIETTFLNALEAACEAAGHNNARRLALALAHVPPGVMVHITHMEPGREEEIWAEIQAACSSRCLRRLTRGEVIVF